MRELSVFVDESGDLGGESKYYLMALIFHDQDNHLAGSIALYERSLAMRNLPDVTLHFGPLLHAHDEYRTMSVRQRSAMLSSFGTFAQHTPFRYRVFQYQKDHFATNEKLFAKMRQDISGYLFDHLGEFQIFDAVKIYYDNGQPLITQVLHAAFEYALAKNAIVYKDSKPQDYRLFQMADFVCGIELTATKYAAHETSTTEKMFFGTWRDFKKNYLRKLRLHELR